MSHARERGKTRRACPLRVEDLEGRRLLSYFDPAPAVAAIRARTVKIPGPLVPITEARGRVVGQQSSDALYGGTPPGFASYSGHGRLNPFGDMMFGTTFLPTRDPANPPVNPLQDGTALFISNRGGNQLRLNYTGAGTSFNPRSGNTVIRLEGVVASGTGRFEGATGTFVATGTIGGGRAGRFSMDYVIRFNPPR